MANVAIIGAGPSGLAAARWLVSEGFDPVIFDQGARLGGQWAGDAKTSGIWPSMRTNTSRVMTAFSDMPHEPGTPVHPGNQVIHAYLTRYAERFDLIKRLRLQTRVTHLGRAKNGWRLRHQSADGDEREEIFERVIVASGRHNKPAIPDVPGLLSFTGELGVASTFAYRDAADYRGRRVLVAGCAVSALEVAADIAMGGAAHVTCTNRRQRYVFHKILAGVPNDHVIYTRCGAMAMTALPREVTAANLKALLLRTSGSPEQFGAPRPAENVFDAGITQSQHFLPLVAEGRIDVKPWIAKIDGRSVHFSDGTTGAFDAILFGTGFLLSLPFLSDEVRAALDVAPRHVDLFERTFHPDLPGLAFAGMLELQGPYFPSLELQSRWIAYVWGKSCAVPSDEAMRSGLAAARAGRGGPLFTPTHVMSLRFSRLAGVEPDVLHWPQLARAIYFGPVTPVSFRLSGRDSLPDAPQRILAESQAFNAVPAGAPNAEQIALLKTLADATHDAALQRLISKLAPPSV